jgi:hypothetical protein
VESPVRRPAADGLSRIGGTAVDVRCFPSDDTTFASCVGAIAASLRETGHGSPAALESRLRATYPSATVHEQTALGSLMPNAATWYVFRDGGG